MTQEEIKKHDLSIVQSIISNLNDGCYDFTLSDQNNSLRFICIPEGATQNPLSFFIYTRNSSLNEMTLVAVYQPNSIATGKEQFIITDGYKCGIQNYFSLIESEENIERISIVAGTLGGLVQALLDEKIKKIKPDESVLTQYDLNNNIPKKARYRALTGRHLTLDDFLNMNNFWIKEVIEILSGQETLETVAEAHFNKYYNSYVRQITINKLALEASLAYGENDPAIQLYRKLAAMEKAGAKTVTIRINCNNNTVQTKIGCGHLSRLLLDIPNPDKKISVYDFPTQNEGKRVYDKIFGYSPYHHTETIYLSNIQEVFYRGKTLWKASECVK